MLLVDVVETCYRATATIIRAERLDAEIIVLADDRRCTAAAVDVETNTEFVRRSEAPTDIDVSAGIVEGLAVELERFIGPVTRALGNEIHRSTDGAEARIVIEKSARALDDVDAFDAVYRRTREVNEAGETVEERRTGDVVEAADREQLVIAILTGTDANRGVVRHDVGERSGLFVLDQLIGESADAIGRLVGAAGAE